MQAESLQSHCVVTVLDRPADRMRPVNTKKAFLVFPYSSELTGRTPSQRLWNQIQTVLTAFYSMMVFSIDVFIEIWTSHLSTRVGRESLGTFYPMVG
jgi:hypothetical protein